MWRASERCISFAERSVKTNMPALSLLCQCAWACGSNCALTLRQLAEELGCYASHVSDYLNPDDAPMRRNLPADKVAAFDYAVGNTAVSQWLAMRSNLPVMVMLDERKAA